MLLKMKKITLVLGLLVLSAFVVNTYAIASPAVFGSVDMEAVFNEAPRKKDNEAKLQAMVAQIRQRIELRQANRLLTADEFNQLADLTAKADKTDADNARITELQNASKTKDQELQALEQKKDANDTDKARLQTLRDLYIASDQELKDSAAKYSEDIEKANIDLSNEVKADINKAVEAVAKEKGLSIVFNKTAGDAILIVYSSVDITDEVTKRLAK